MGKVGYQEIVLVWFSINLESFINLYFCIKSLFLLIFDAESNFFNTKSPAAVVLKKFL